MNGFRQLIDKVGRIIHTKSDRTLVNLLKSIFTSLIAFSVDASLLALMVEKFDFFYLWVNPISFIAGASVSYLLSIAVVFKTRSFRNKKAEYLTFLVIGAVGVGLNSAFLWLLTHGAGIYYMYSKVIAGSTVFFWNFFARKFLLFRNRNRDYRVGENSIPS